VSRSGPELALLLLAGFQTLVDETRRELEQRGHPDHRPVHHFALRAIAAGADTVSDLGEALAVSRQAATKTVAVLEGRGYVQRRSDPADGRRRPLTLTNRGRDLLAQGESIMDELRTRWADTIGPEQLESVEDHLTQLVGRPDRDDTARWMAQDLDASA
jgi:DNA-binding MarR family transcriptional regulator